MGPASAAIAARRRKADGRVRADDPAGFGERAFHLLARFGVADALGVETHAGETFAHIGGIAPAPLAESSA